jgi:hypothetical protein
MMTELRGKFHVKLNTGTSLRASNIFLNMESILDEMFENGEIDQILAGTPITWDKVPRTNRKDVSRILVHCCINGPVSPHKVTTYPLVGEKSLQSLVGDQRISNSGLQRSCEEVAKALEAKGFRKGRLYEEHGHFWPMF